MLSNLLIYLLQVNFDFMNNYNEFVDKNNILFLINILNLFAYSFYKFIKNFSLIMQYYFIKFYIFFIYNNMLNLFFGNFLYYFLVIKNNIAYIYRYFFKRIIKKKRI
jgi:hypothetical protein